MKRIWSNPLAYVLLFPLLFFAVHGAFSFDRPSREFRVSDEGEMQNGALLLGQATGNPRVAQSEVAAALILIILAMIPRAKTILRSCQQRKVLSALPLLSLASAFWSQDPIKTLHFGIYLALNVLFAFYIVDRFRPKEQMQLVMFAGFAAAILSLVLVIFFPEYGVLTTGRAGTWQGIFVTENSCALGMLFLLTPALFASRRDGTPTVLRMAYIAIVILIIAMTRSRSGWLYTGAAILIAVSFEALRRFRSMESRALILLGTFGTLILAPIILSFLPEVTALLGRDSTLSGRTDLWIQAVQSIAKRPLLGYGYDAFWNGMQGESARVLIAVGWVAPYAHNGYIDVLLELGLAGIVLVGITLWRALCDAVRSIRPFCPREVGWYTSIIVLTSLYNLVEGTFLAPNFLPWILYTVACLGLANHLQEIRSPAVARRDRVYA